MATIQIAGNAVVVKSTLTVDQLSLVKKFRPNALVLTEGEGKDAKPVFAVTVAATQNGSINSLGAVFPATTNDPDGKAQITVIANFGADTDPATAVCDTLGGALINLNCIEASLPDVIAEIEAERETVLAQITVV